MRRRTATTLFGVIGFIIISGCGTVAPGPAPTGNPSAAWPGGKERAAASAPRRIMVTRGCPPARRGGVRAAKP